MDSESISFCGLKFNGLKKVSILNRDCFQQIVTVGAEFIIEAHKNRRMREIINHNVSTFDGQVPYFLAKKKNPSRDFDKISGADLIYDVCEVAKKNNRKIFLLGGYTDSNSLSVKKMKKMGIEASGFVTGFIPYPFPMEKIKEIKQQIAEFSPYYLFVGLGMGKQEYFISENKDFLIECGVRLAVGCGGTMEVFSGKINRAPVWMQKYGLESIYRVLKEPSLNRIKRVLSTLKFLKYINE